MKNIRVLIVDDSAVMRKMIERSLRQAGIAIAQVLEANDGWEGLAVVQKEPLDLILCDINMPTMDGMEFLRNVQNTEKARGVPVVMVTTEGSEIRASEAMATGARGYITKPFTTEQIKAQIAPLVEEG